MRPRREQAQIQIRSDFVAERLKALTSNGRSQAAVLEEALAKASDPMSTNYNRDHQAFQKLLEIASRSSKAQTRFKSMAEFDAHEYDINGNCR